MNENVKQNQPVSLFSFLILRVAGLLNSADFSRSCTSSSCNISLSFSSSALTQARRRRRLFPIACLDSRLSSLTPPTVPKCLAILGRWKTRSCILGATLPLKTLGNTTPTSRQRVSRSKNMIKNYFTIFCKKMSIFVRNSSNFLHTIFIPQANIGTKKPLKPAKIGAKTTPLFYKRRNKIVKPRSMIWSIKRWIVLNGLAIILTPKSTS